MNYCAKPFSYVIVNLQDLFLRSALVFACKPPKIHKSIMLRVFMPSIVSGFRFHHGTGQEYR